MLMYLRKKKSAISAGPLFLGALLSLQMGICTVFATTVPDTAVDRELEVGDEIIIEDEAIPYGELDTPNSSDSSESPSSSAEPSSVSTAEPTSISLSEPVSNEQFILTDSPVALDEPVLPETSGVPLAWLLTVGAALLGGGARIRKRAS